jgi:S-adenosylmethionine synthetase
MMFGYACDETPDLMPYPIWLAHRLVQRQAELRKSGAMPWLRPDAKSQVTVAYEGQKMVGVETVIVSTQIARDLDPAWVAQEVAREIVDPLVPAELRTPTYRLWVNPAGPFEIGGPNGDTGLTGRKIIVDTYGGSCPHGGGAFSGKDPTKVDRSAAYMARYIAKNLVAAGMARRCLVQLAYAIGVAEPVSLLIDTYGTGSLPDEKLEDMVRCTFKLTPRGIIESLDLRRPIYQKTAAYGHFGRAEPDFTWERTDQAQALAAFKA